MGICRLCNEDKDLLKKSHIYPNFVYTDLFDEHNRLRKFTANEMLKKNPRISRPLLEFTKVVCYVMIVIIERLVNWNHMLQN